MDYIKIPFLASESLLHHFAKQWLYNRRDLRVKGLGTIKYYDPEYEQELKKSRKKSDIRFTWNRKLSHTEIIVENEVLDEYKIVKYDPDSTFIICLKNMTNCFYSYEDFCIWADANITAMTLRQYAKAANIEL